MISYPTSYHSSLTMDFIFFFLAVNFDSNSDDFHLKIVKISLVKGLFIY